MKKELQEKLFTKFPKLFRDKDEHMSKTCMCWGISTGNGWYNIIDALCTELTTYAGERGLDVVATQVKEKFAGLRFNIVGGDEQVHKIISNYESMSYKICEQCGCEGKRRGGSWIHTMCDACWEKWQTGWRPWREDTPTITLYKLMFGKEEGED